MLQVEKDSTFCLLDGNTRCGKMFVGLGKLLVGAKVGFFVK